MICVKSVYPFKIIKKEILLNEVQQFVITEDDDSHYRLRLSTKNCIGDPFIIAEGTKEWCTETFNKINKSNNFNLIFIAESNNTP